MGISEKIKDHSRDGGLVTAIAASGRGSLADHNLGKARQHGSQPFPDPFGQHFKSRILESRDVVQVVVIQFLDDWLHGKTDLGMIHKPTHVRINLSFDANLDFETVPVQPATLVPSGTFGRVCADSNEKSLVRRTCISPPLLQNIRGFAISCRKRESDASC